MQTIVFILRQPNRAWADQGTGGTLQEAIMDIAELRSPHHIKSIDVLPPTPGKPREVVVHFDNSQETYELTYRKCTVCESADWLTEIPVYFVPAELPF